MQYHGKSLIGTDFNFQHEIDPKHTATALKATE